MDALPAIRTAIEPLMRGGMPLDALPESRALRALGPSAIAPFEPGAGPSSIGQAPGVHPFESVLGKFVQDVNSKQLASADAVRGLLSGEEIPLHRVMIATEEASVSFQLMVEVRNKLLEAYQELMRMQV